MILLDFYLTHYKVYIHKPCINTHRQKTAPFDITHAIIFSDLQTPRLYQGSAEHCEVDCNCNIICLLHPSHIIHNCNQSVVAIVPDLNIFVWSITILISFREELWYNSFLLHSSYFYNSMEPRFHIFGLLQDSRLRHKKFHRWVHCIVTTKIWC